MDRNIDYVALGKRIKNKRIENKLTQEQLGEICDLSAAHIGHIERGTRILSVDVLFRIAHVLNISVDYLLFDSVENENILSSIAPLLENIDKNKASNFLKTVRVLAENIDKL
ncbi:MAG: helix-turn-helix domain-containing protein [Hominimerdicola sp.]